MAASYFFSAIKILAFSIWSSRSLIAGEVEPCDAAVEIEELPELAPAETSREPGGRRGIAGHVPAMQRTELGGFCAVDVDFLAGDRTFGRGQLQGVGIDGHARDAFGHVKGLHVAIRGKLYGAAHEIGPDRRRSVRPGKTQV